MIIRLAVVGLVALYASIAHAQIPVKEDTTVSGWKKGAFASLTFNQVSLINWAAGGENSFSTLGIFNAFAKYRKNDLYFESTLDLGLGYISTKSLGLRKNEDKAEFNAQAGKKLKGKWYYAGLLNFRTQFAPGFNFPNDSVIISRGMAPGFLTLALGFDYKPVEYFYFFFSPVTGRATFVLDDSLSQAGQFGVTPGQRVRLEFGASARIRFQRTFKDKTTILSNLQLFNNYTDPIKKQRGNVDVNFENMVSIKAGKLLTVSLFLNYIYDHDININTGRLREDGSPEIGPRSQFKEVLGAGISYKW